METDDYELVPLGHYMGKKGYFFFSLIFILLTGGLFVGSTYTHDMYVYNDIAYHHCVKAMNAITSEPIPVDEGHKWDGLAGTTEQDFFFVPEMCDVAITPHIEDNS